MKNSVVFKPVLWRLIVWNFVPVYIGWALSILVHRWIKGYSNFYLLESAIIIMIVTVIINFVFRKRYDVVISDGNISGPGIGAFLPVETFSIADLDISYLHKQSFYEKISFFRTIRSTSGKKIMIDDFIYGNPISSDIYKILEQDHLSKV